MKLFVWHEWYNQRYSGSVAFAVATNLNEAYKVLLPKFAEDSYLLRYSLAKPFTITELKSLLGKPDEVLTVPAAGQYHWEE